MPGPFGPFLRGAARARVKVNVIGPAWLVWAEVGQVIRHIGQRRQPSPVAVAEERTSHHGG